MLNDAFKDIITAFTRYQLAIDQLEAEIKRINLLNNDLCARISGLEDQGVSESDLKDQIGMLLETNTFDSMLEDKVREAVESYDFDDAIESALSGREITVTL